MEKIIFICDLQTCSYERVKKILSLLKDKPNEIILHYAYQIPENSTDIIGVNDKIKEEANEILQKAANNILEKEGIKSSVNIVLGSTKSTLRRLLRKNNVRFVVGQHNDHGNIIDTHFKNEFKDITYIFSSPVEVNDVQNKVEHELNITRVKELFDFEKIAESLELGQIKFYENFKTHVNDLAETIIIL